MKEYLALACTLLCLGGCSRKPEEIPEIKPAPTPERTYKHPTHGFVVRVPDGWEIKDTGHQGPIAVAFVRPRRSSEEVTESFMVQVEPGKPGFTAQQYFEESLAERRLVKDFQLISTAPETIGKTEALGAIARMDLGPYVVQVLSYTIVHGPKVYTLTAMATPDTFDEFKGIFRSLALTFEPGEAPAPGK